jgi:hypothetical protein
MRNSPQQIRSEGSVNRTHCGLQVGATQEAIRSLDAVLIRRPARQAPAEPSQPKLTTLHHTVDAAPERGTRLRVQKVEPSLE